MTPIQVGASCKWADDSQHLLLEYFDEISGCPSKLYHCALPFCPSSSWLHQYYATEFLQEVKVVKGLPAEWGSCSRTVALDTRAFSIACWKDTIGVGLSSGDIVTLDGITGIQTAVLSGHTSWVESLAFSPDGTSLVSGGFDKTIKLWDVQTGGVVKTFYGHTHRIQFISISANFTMIASGSDDKTIRLWDIQTEECCRVIMQQSWVCCVRFSPTDPQHLISVSGDKIWQWDINGHQIKPTYDGSSIAFSPDGTQVVLCQGENIVVQRTDSGAIVAKFHMANSEANHCCFSPNGRLIAVAIDSTAIVWDTTSSATHPIETFVGHTDVITSLVFSSPSSLLSSSLDQSAKFWQIGTLPTDSVVTDMGSTLSTPARIKSITLQADLGIVLSSDSDGVVRIWDISTGLCKASSKTPAGGAKWNDAQLINSRLTCVWYENEKIHIWSAGDRKPQLLDATSDDVEDVRISGDGCNVLCLKYESVRAWSMLSRAVVGDVRLKYSDSRRMLSVDGSRVWVHSPVSETQGWDFGVPGSPPILLPNSALLRPSSTKLWDRFNFMLRDIVNGKVFFQLAGGFSDPFDSQWDGQYLVAGYASGEVLILDFNHVQF